MQMTSYQHRHKLGLAALLLILFALPFVLERQALERHDTNIFMAGGAVIGKPSIPTAPPSESVSNNSGVMAATAGKTLLGIRAQ